MRRLLILIFLLILAAGIRIVSLSYLRMKDRNENSPSKAVLSKSNLAEPPSDAASRIRFSDVASKCGLHYRWTITAKRPLNILQTIGNGCAFLDYNNDGNLDILLVGTDHVALYQGDGHGHFNDVSHATGLDMLKGHFLGCAVGDYDNDGFDDLYLSGYQTGVLLHNEGGKFFQDETQAMGLAPQPWGTSCAFADVDGDGYLDLFVCNYVQFDTHTVQLCQRDGLLTACDPNHYHRLKGVLYHNLGGHGFADVTHAWGLDTQTGNALGIACADIDGSGHISLAIANDEPGDDLFKNRGSGQLYNVSLQAGTRGDRRGSLHAGMGIDWGDYDNDGKPDFFVTTFERETKCLYNNEGNGLFSEVSASAGIETALIAYVSFGCKFLDVDNDGWLDLLVASGHVEDGVEQIHKGTTYRQPLRLLYNTGGDSGRPDIFLNLKRGTSLDKLSPIVGRGLATGDFDNDGRMDALVVDSEGAPLLLHNQTSQAGHWIGLRLIGTGKSNRDAYGAVVTVRMGKRRLTRICHADGSYLSSSDKRVHIGLGNANRIDGISVRWPDGKTQIWPRLSVDRYFTLMEGRAKVL